MGRTSSVLIGGQVATVTNTTLRAFVATITVTAGSVEGLLSFVVYDYFNLAGTVGVNRTTVSDSSSVRIGN